MSSIEGSFPEFYRQADQFSKDSQLKYLITECIQLLSILFAAGIGTLKGPPPIVVTLFAVALASQISRHYFRYDEKWWNGRAGAESTKTAAWRFVVGGEPLGIGNTNAAAEFSSTVTEIAKYVAKLEPLAVHSSHVTPQMRTLRDQTLARRVSVYRDERIQDQLSWYQRRSLSNKLHEKTWSFAGFASSFLAFMYGIGVLLWGWDLEPIGFFSALGASIAAWIAVKQFQVLARSYAVANAELALIAGTIGDPDRWEETEWARFVDDAEEAISREHVSWRASRGV